MGGIHYNDKGKPDERDLAILRILYSDGRMSIADIAAKTGQQRDSVARRIKNMRDKGVMTGIIPVVNPGALGLPNVCILLLKLNVLDKATKDRFQMLLKGNRYVVHIAKLLGEYDYYCAVLYRHTGHLDSIIEMIKNYVPNIIETVKVYQIVEEPKFESMQDLLSEDV